MAAFGAGVGGRDRGEVVAALGAQVRTGSASGVHSALECERGEKGGCEGKGPSGELKFVAVREPVKVPEAEPEFAGPSDHVCFVRHEKIKLSVDNLRGAHAS